VLSERFKTHHELFCDNGGSIENFVTMLKIKHAKRVILAEYKEKRNINLSDFDATVKAISGDKPKEKFMSMYL